MKRFAILAGLLLLPATAMASHEVNVDVHIAGSRDVGGYGHGYGYRSDGTETWVEFYPDRGAFVALYAAYSDGSVSLIYPLDGERNWVDARHGGAVPVWIPRGLRLESVQVVASRRWFDPAECWVTGGPPYGHAYGHPGSAVVVHTVNRGPLYTWNFAVSWGSSSHCYEIVRRTHWEPRHVEHVTWSPPSTPPVKYKSVRVNRTSQGAQYAGSNAAARSKDDRWTPGDAAGAKSKAKAAPGHKSSKSRKGSGEPGRASKR
jgi:hypothetical protein